MTMTMPATTVPSTPARDGHMIIDGRMLVFSEVAAHVVNVTPEDAAALLARTKQNRKVDKANSKKLITAINEGDFGFNGSSICLSSEGFFLDGQHRMLALIATGTTAPFVIATGIIEKAQSTMDTGRPRTLAENLYLAGERQENDLSGALIGIQSWEAGERALQTSHRGATIDRSLRFLAEHPEIRDISRQGKNLARSIPSLSGKYIAQFIWAFDKIDVDDRKAFFEQLASGAGLSEGDPILSLRNFLHANAMSNAKVTAYHLSGITCKAWNFWREGEKKRLNFRPGGSNPEKFPEPR